MIGESAMLAFAGVGHLGYRHAGPSVAATSEPRRRGAGLAVWSAVARERTAAMSNVLSDTTREQVIALGRLGWSARRIERETGVRRETASAYLKAAGSGVRPAGR